jgi:hypothetical protein
MPLRSSVSVDLQDSSAVLGTGRPKEFYCSFNTVLKKSQSFAFLYVCCITLFLEGKNPNLPS